MREVFLGPVRFWVVLLLVVAVLWMAGRAQLHVTDFAWFLALLAGLAAVSVLAILLTRRPGERITRDPIDEAAEIDFSPE